MKDDQLPRLRFDDGNVLIKLSTNRDRHLLVHSDVIQAGLPTLAPTLKPEWSVPEVIKHPLTEKEINIYSLALKSDVAIDLNVPESIVFPQSQLALEGWPETKFYGNTVRNNAKIAEHAHHALVALLYGYDIPRWSIYAGSLVDEDGESVFNHDIAEMAAIILSYAEYYGGLQRIAPLLFQQLEQRGPLLRRSPQSRCPESAEVHREHYTPGDQTSYDCDTRPAVEVLGMTPAEYAERFQTDLDALDYKLHKLEHDLLKLQLHIFYYTYDRQKYLARTHFQNFIRVKSSIRPDHSASAKAWERYEFLACFGWGQWVDPPNSSRVRRYPFNVTCRKILEAAASENPSELLGYKCASRLSSIFSLGFQFQAEKRVKRVLDELVREAARTLGAAFFEHGHAA
ncbi:hypothetical protein KC352_g4713 [Hortaea werneckii]|nr:hypothetical protein KC350_g10025 [Hortaea werneckii]KAI6843117.1 hypothetical protein KC358_g3941 [Hortaea werneckii]KAI6940046.1 hypothetical protein KC341_g3792 [Hortaea werneckii]KAI6943765.1 hypothetical protein KC348_g4159 [Hortaea werneckii]KAI6976537.1 hypothetical protein KC321_g3961 [Hortaea werneckii]